MTSASGERSRLLQRIANYLGRCATRGLLGSFARSALELAEQLLAEQTLDAPQLIDALAHVERTFELRPFERDALLLAVLAETDWRFGRLLAFAQDHPQLTRPTVGLSLLLSEASVSVLELTDGPLVRDGLVVLEGEGTIASRVMRVTSGIAARLTTGPTLRADLMEPEADVLATLILDEPTRDAIQRWKSSPMRPLILAGPIGSGRRTLARAAAGSAGQRLVTVELRPGSDAALIARRESRWHDAALLLVSDGLSGDEWRAVWRSLDTVQAPVLLAVAENEAEPASIACPVQPHVIHLGSFEPELRRPIWRALLPPSIDDAGVDALSTRFAFLPGRIARVIDAARALSRDEAVSLTAVMTAARDLGRAQMSSLASRMSLPFTREDLIVTDRVHSELDLAHAWVRHQQRVQVEWGLGRRIARGRGLTALFAGEPGTGKTMAAQVLARELELELYAIDLSRVLSKYIGETEKNLAKLFDEARDSGVMLFFDEGDALFGKRTETRDAHDRYANVEISYLLQRLERHEGVTVLATNRLRDLDEAFLRRFHIVADFTLPEPADRLQIWNRMLAPPVACDGDLRLNVIARELALSGGQIRNAALAAAHFAASEAQAISRRHLERALRRELKQQGRVFDERVSRVLGTVRSS